MFQKFAWPFLFCFAGVVFSLSAQVRFEASTDAKEVIEGNFFEVRFTLYNANGNDFSPPDFRPFTVVSGPNRSLSTTNINGNVSHEMTISYTLLAERPGTFRVNPAKIKVKGKLYSTRALTVQVLKGGNTKAPGTPGQEIFLVASLSDSVAYVGQQILLDYKIYTTKNVESYNLLRESDYEGFFVEEIKRFNPRPVREVVNGIQYTSKIIKRVALFPQQSGKLEIDPMMIQIGVETGNARRRGFFLTRNLEYMNISSQSLSAKVLGFPGEVPENFSGAVGTYELAVVSGGTRIYTNDAFSLKLIIRGNGDNKRVIPPDIEFPDAFEPYPSKVLADNVREVVGEITHVKEIEYLAVPNEPGQYAIRPGLTYFNTDSAAFVTLYADSVRVNVLQAGARSTDQLDAFTDQLKDIHPIVMEKGLSMAGQQLFVRPWVWILTIAPFFGIGFIFYNQRKKVNQPSESRLEKLRKEAEKVALGRLEQARKAKDANQPPAFYEAISVALFGYVRHKLNLSMAALTKANARKKLEEAGATGEQVASFQDLVNTCEMALFAGRSGEREMTEVFEKARQLITELETRLG